MQRAEGNRDALSGLVFITERVLAVNLQND